MSLFTLIFFITTIFIACIFFLFILLMQRNTRTTNDDESRMIQEMLQGLMRLEERVDTLETLIITTHNQDKQ